MIKPIVHYSKFSDTKIIRCYFQRCKYYRIKILHRKDYGKVGNLCFGIFPYTYISVL